MANFTNTDRVAEMCRQIPPLVGRWDSDRRVKIDVVQPLREAWVAIVYRNPAAGPRLGLVLDLDSLAAGFDPELTVTELAGEIVQSFLIEPAGPGLEVDHPWLNDLNQKFGPLRWKGDAVELPSAPPDELSPGAGISP
jgi:hypothetical protein